MQCVDGVAAVAVDVGHRAHVPQAEMLQHHTLDEGEPGEDADPPAVGQGVGERIPQRRSQSRGA